MLGAAMQKSHTAEAVKPLLIAQNFDQNSMKPALPEVREAVKTRYSTQNVSPKDEDAVGGAGEIVTKKPFKKFTKGDDEKIGKKSVTTVSDKIPKKLAQRAKGTTSIKKPTIKTSLDFEAKPKAAVCHKVSLESQKSKDDCIDKLKSKSESEKPGGTLDKKFKSKLKKPGIRISKKDPYLTCPIASEPMAENETYDTQTNDTVIIEEFKSEIPTGASEIRMKEAKDDPKAASTTTASSFSQSMNCSFLERLQLGVKSYFSSRNAIICSDKNKKEGGNQTRARVGTEVKEDAQKTDPGFEFKNHFYISESDSLPDQLRLDSYLGGESNSSLTDKIEISQNHKRRKLKNNVRIQIPRKGYFYRSSAPSKTPELQLPSRQPKQLEFERFDKNKSKNQNFRVAPTGAQIPHVPDKKRNVKTWISPVEADMEFLNSDEDSIGSNRSGSSNWSIPRVRFVERDTVYDVLGSAAKRRSRKNSSLPFDLYSELEEQDRERYSVLEKSLIVDGEKKRKKNTTAFGGDYFENIESGNKPPSSLKTLTSCITSVLGNDELFNNLEITPVNPEKDIKLESISEESPKPLITSVPIDSIPSSSTFDGKDNQMNPTAILMGEIDLHLELQNYLKAFNSFSVSKTRTKNTLHSNKTFGIQDPEFLRTEELSEGHGNKKNLLSPTCYANSEFSSSDELEEERIESRLPRSQTQLSDILRHILKENSIDKMKSPRNSIDSYEKILPFGPEFPIRLNSSSMRYGELIFDNFVTNAPPKTRCKPPNGQKAPNHLDLNDKTEIFYNVLQDYGRVGWRQKKSFNSFFSYLIPLLNEKGTNRLRKVDLINFAKEMTDRQGRKNFKGKENIKLKMYVNMFQKVLKSPLSFRQIIYLNSMISAWESNSEDFVKYLKKKNVKPNAVKVKKRTNSQQKISTSKLSSSKSASTIIPSTRKPETKPTKNLQMTLESFLNLEGEDYSSLSAMKGKVGLVDIKLTGNQIQVKDLSFVNDEIPSSKKSDLDGSSELIIESVEKSQMNNFFNESTNLRANKPLKKNTNPKEKVIKNFPPQFEYDENQLRAQHPIDPILELPEYQIKKEKLPPTIYSTKIDSDFLKSAFENPFYLEHLVEPDELKKKTPFSKAAPELPKTTKSMVDIKANSLKKVHKTPSAWSRSFFCYSSLHSQQNNLFKDGNKEKKSGGGSKTAKKKQQQQRQKPDYDWLMKNDGPSDMSNLEYLFFDKLPENEKIPNNQSASVTNLIVEEEEPKISNNLNMAILPQSSNQFVDNESFSLDLVHSDSFLKRFSNMSVLERDTKLLFQNGPDFNFRPLMWVDRKKDPSSLTNEDVMVILRKKLPMTFQKSSSAEEIIFENGISSYENSGSEAKKKKKFKTAEKKFCPPLFKDRKTKTRCQTCQFLSKQVSPTQKQKSGKQNMGSPIKNNKTTAAKVKNEKSKLFSRNAIQSERCSENRLEEKRLKMGEMKKKIKEKKDEAPASRAGNISKVSLNLEDIPLELLEALKRTFNQVESLKRKKINSAIEKKKQIGRRFLDLKPTKSFTLKIHCENPTKGKQTKGKDVAPKDKSQKLDSRKINVKDSREDESLFFDAVEKNTKEDIRGEIEASFKSCNSGSPTSKDKSDPWSTDNRVQEEKSEEALLTQISDCLVEGQISCSLLLLDSLLKKKEKSEKFNQRIELVDENTENLITSLERSTWQVLMILEALTQQVEKNNNENLKEQLKTTKEVVNKILVLNINRLASFHKLNSANELTEGADDENNTFGIVGQCLRNLRQMFALKGTAEERKKENEMAKLKTKNPFDLNQKTVVESDMSDIRKMKNKVVDELKSLEKMFLAPKQTSSSFTEEQTLEEGQSRGEGTPSEDWLHRTYDCMHLMQCLLKVWDTRMSLNTYPSDCLR